MTAINRFIAGPFGGLVLHPWYDPVAHAGIVRFYLPLSRAWAEASWGGGATAALRQRYDDSDRRFAGAAFGKDGDLVALMAARAGAADAWMRDRGAYWREALMGRTPPVKFAIEPPGAVDVRHAARRDDPVRAFPFATATIEHSRTVTLPDRTLSWLRYPAAGGHDGLAWARVDAPPSGPIAGTAIFAHGILIERELLSGLYDYAPAFLAPAGGAMRLIQPEGPWHGRRMKPGWYGGEPVLGNPVGGLLDYFAAHVVEIGRLIAWARTVHGGSVAVVGVSLGALTTQLLLSAARHWPTDARPDAALLITTSGSLLDVSFQGSLAVSLHLPKRLHAAGWDEARITAYRTLLEPGDPALPPDRIVAVLGQTDTVTPIAGGERLVERWRLPSANVFRRPGGHFSAAFSVLRDMAPVEVLKRVVRSG